MSDDPLFAPASLTAILLVPLLCGLLTFLDENDWPSAPAVSLLAVLVAALVAVLVAAILVVLVVVVVGVGALVLVVVVVGVAPLSASSPSILSYPASVCSQAIAS